MSRALFDSAHNKWKQAGIVDYDLQYRMNGSDYVVTVRSGIVTSAQVDGQQPLSSDWRTYAMDGLFEILALELDNQEEGIGPFAGGSNVPVRVRFNIEQGYIERFLRAGSGRGAIIETVKLSVTTPTS